jgi:hypothetical protein
VLPRPGKSSERGRIMYYKKKFENAVLFHENNTVVEQIESAETEIQGGDD